MLVREANTTRPTHVPMLFDLEALHPTMRKFLQWAILKEDNLDSGLLMPRELEFMIDPSPWFARSREISKIWGRLSSTSLCMKSFTNGLEVVRVVQRFRQIGLTMNWANSWPEENPFANLPHDSPRDFQAQVHCRERMLYNFMQKVLVDMQEANPREEEARELLIRLLVMPKFMSILF